MHNGPRVRLAAVLTNIENLPFCTHNDHAWVADFCVEQKVGLVGFDYTTVDKYSQDYFPVHQKLLGNDILILEAVNLKDVPPGRYTLFCSPLKLKGAEGAPARAVLVR